MRSPWLVLVVTACAPRAVTPPSRTFVIDAPVTPPSGSSDIQLDAARIGTILGPKLVAGNARVRHSVTPTLVIEADGGLLHVTNDGSGGDRTAFTGRAGAIVRSRDQRFAALVGLGGGTSKVAGMWGAVDAGVAAAGNHRWIRPVLNASVGYSAPFGEQTFTVAQGDVSAELRLPANMFTSFGAGLELGSRETSFVIGVSMIRFWLLESSVVSETEYDHDGYLVVGAGVRVQLE
ncbi:MAG: hypothetical protein AB7P03_17815 [Kofleriaceae bacterium]